MWRAIAGRAWLALRSGCAGSRISSRLVSGRSKVYLADRRFAVSAVAWLIVVLVLVVLVAVLGVFVRRRRRAGGVIATRRKR